MSDNSKDGSISRKPESSRNKNETPQHHGSNKSEVAIDKLLLEKSQKKETENSKSGISGFFGSLNPYKKEDKNHSSTGS
jgi:hypothetical protein